MGKLLSAFSIALRPVCPRSGLFPPCIIDHPMYVQAGGGGTKGRKGSLDRAPLPAFLWEREGSGAHTREKGGTAAEANSFSAKGKGPERGGYIRGGGK